MKIPRHPDDLIKVWLANALESTDTLTHSQLTSCASQRLISDKGMTEPIGRVRL